MDFAQFGWKSPLSSFCKRVEMFLFDNKSNLESRSPKNALLIKI